VIIERFAREAPALRPLPQHRYDTSYYDVRLVGWDGYVDVRGNRYSVECELPGGSVVVRIGLEGTLRLYHADRLVASHALRTAGQGRATVPEHHAGLWREALGVQRRPLEGCEEAARWS
jgi:hypothetical protein